MGALLRGGSGVSGGARLVLLVALSLGPACGGSPAVPACPDGGTVLTYEGFGRPFLDANCSWCHGATVTDRRGAPTDFTFDTLDEVIAHRDRIYARATGDRPSMPPGPTKPAADERQRLATWLSCAPP